MNTAQVESSSEIRNQGAKTSDVIAVTEEIWPNLVDTLTANVPRDVLTRVAQRNLSFDVDKVGFGDPYEQIVRQVVEFAERRGRLNEFVAGVVANINDPTPFARDKIETINAVQSDINSREIGGNDMLGTTLQNSANLVKHYVRLSAGRQQPGGALEVLGALESVKERVESTEDSLLRIVSDYLGNEPRLKEIARQIARDGGEALRMVQANDGEALARRPELASSLEAIVRTDGSRPSFLIVNGDVDRKSSPLGGWADLLDKNSDNFRSAVACVGRIDVPGSSAGFLGTGFLIQENLILTNRHVLQLAARFQNGNWKFADYAAIDFGHEFRGRDSVNRRRLRRVLFYGSKQIDFDKIDHSKLDLALIEIEPASSSSVKTVVLPLSLSPAWATTGATIITIGYPGSPQSMLYPPTLLEQLFQSTYGYKRLAPGELMQSQSDVQPWTLTHDATTLGGNSGSVVLVANNATLSAGLHYGGRGVEPRENWGHVLADVLGETSGSSPKTLSEVLTENGVRIDGAARPHPITTTPQDASSPDTRTTHRRCQRPTNGWRRGVVTLEMMQPLTAVPGRSRLEAAQFEAAGDGHTPASELADRAGYDPDFIDDFAIPLPTPAGDMRNLRRGGTGHELKYEHFSVIMSASRRMPMLTASNIDGAQSRRLPRIQQWSYDGRLNDEDQWGNELYLDNDVDRGHMVRREDPVWGSLAVARRANVDTFHYTNSCPQMAGVNQHIWLGLENYILSHAREDDMRINVFTGPFFSQQDLPYRDALIPKAFWKIVAFILPDGRPSATAYRVSQARELEELEFVYAAYRTFQISIQQIMNATNIDFSAMLPFDGFSQHERVHGVAITERLESFSQIRV